MKLNVVPTVSSAIVAALLLGMATQLPAADTQPGKIQVVGKKGTASAFAAGASPAPVNIKDVYGPGTTVKTDKASSVDLFFGKNIGTMRLEESGTLIIDKFTLTETGADTVADIQLNLPEGTILGNVNKLSAASKYEIKVPSGVAGIRGTTLLASAAAYFVLIEGALVFVHVPPGGNPTPYTLQAPPPVYFSPLEGVKPAPQDLINNVNSRLPGGRAPLAGAEIGLAPQLRGPLADDRPPFVSPGVGGIQ
jgi:hypothetical protein